MNVLLQNKLAQCGMSPPPGEGEIITTCKDVERLCHEIRAGQIPLIERDLIEKARDELSSVLEWSKRQ